MLDYSLWEVIENDAKSLLRAVEKKFGGNATNKNTQRNLLKQRQPNTQQLDNEDLQQIYPDDLEEMDLRWQMVMLTMRARRFLKNTRTLVSYDGLGGYDWSDQAKEGPTNFAPMAYSSTSIRKGTKKAVEKRFGGNTATKKTQKNLLKQQYENFTASSSEVLDQTFDRLQKIFSKLEIHGESISQQDANKKFLRSLSPEWNTHTIVWRKFSLNGNETIGFDKSKVRCYNCHKRGHFSMECRALRSKYTKHKESTRRTMPVETPASAALVSCDGLGGYDWSDQAKKGPTNFTLMAYSSTSSNSKRMRMKQYIQMVDYSLWEVIENVNAPQITQVVECVMIIIAPATAEEKAQRRALEGMSILKDLEESSKAAMAMLTMKAKRFLKNIRRKFSLNGNDTIGFDKSKVECYNFHNRRHFARECRSPRSQDTKHKESTRRIVPVETPASTALVSCDGLGSYYWGDQAKEGPTNFALMAYSSTSSNSENGNAPPITQVLETTIALATAEEKTQKE
nr:ribonuclease H-like domain-containing protein [Tanacetum cinerariifolium]